MNKYLIVIGAQSGKLELVPRKFKKELLSYAHSASEIYDGVISVVRVKNVDAINFKKSKDTIAKDTIEHLEYQSDTVIEVPGYDVNVSNFRRDAEYDIIGISTAASVLCTAMSMYSQGLKINVLSKYVYDRKGEKFHQAALNIMREYMPGCVK